MSYDKRSASGHRAPSAASVRSDKKDRKNGHQSTTPVHGSNGHLRVPSHSYEDSGSEVYVTSGAYRAPSEMRYPDFIEFRDQNQTHKFVDPPNDQRFIT